MEENKMEEVEYEYDYEYDKDKIINFLYNYVNLLNIKNGDIINLHFMTYVDDAFCNSEINIIKDNYVEEDGLVNIIISCEKQEYLDEWKVKNGLPEKLYLLSDYNREWANTFSILDVEFDLPNKLSCLISPWNGNVFWSTMFGFNEQRRNLESFVEFNSKILKNLKEIM